MDLLNFEQSMLKSARFKALIIWFVEPNNAQCSGLLTTNKTLDASSWSGEFKWTLIAHCARDLMNL